MAQTVKLKRSATPAKVPSTTDLALGELAINTYDGKLYLKKDVGGVQSIVTINSGGSSVTISTTAPSTPTAGDLWWSSEEGKLKVYYNDGSSSQWVDAFTGTIAGIALVAYLAVASANYTLTSSDYAVNWTAGTQTATLPSAVLAGAGKQYVIKNSGTGMLTVATTSSQTIDGQLYQYLNQWDSITVVSDGSNWLII